MFEFHLTEVYLRQQQERIVKHAERHRMTRPAGGGRGRPLRGLTKRLRVAAGSQPPARTAISPPPRP